MSASHYADLAVEDGVIVKNRFGRSTRSRLCTEREKILGASLNAMVKQTEVDGESLYVFTEKQLDQYVQDMKRSQE